MTKIIKRSLAIVMVVCMLAVMLSCATGCGGGIKRYDRRKDGETVELTWAISATWADQKDTAAVDKLITEKLQQFEQTKGLSFKTIGMDADNYIQRIAAGEQIDIVWTGYSYNMTSVIQSDGYLGLDEYITEEAYPNLWREWKEEYVDDYMSGTYVDPEGNKTLYAIPNQQPVFGISPYLQIPASTLECLDVDAMHKARNNSPYLTAEFMDVLTDYLQNVWDKKLYNTDTVSDTVAMAGLYDVVAQLGYGGVGTAPVAFRQWDEKGNVTDKVEIVDFFASEEFKTFCKYAAKWYEMGFIDKEELTSASGSGGGNLSMVIYAHQNGMWYGLEDEKNGIDEVVDKFGSVTDLHVNINTQEKPWNALGASTLGSEKTYEALPITCAHPYDALDLLDLLRAPAYEVDENGKPKVDENGVKIRTPENELLNLIVYGIEAGSEDEQKAGISHYSLGGEDGELIEGEYITQPDATSSYGRCWWMMGNVYLMRRTQAWNAGQNDYASNYEKKVKPELPKTPLYQFRENVTGIVDEISYINNTRTEYLQTLRYGIKGSKGWQKTYQEFMQKREAAGIQKVIDEMQSQVDAYVAK